MFDGVCEWPRALVTAFQFAIKGFSAKQFFVRNYSSVVCFSRTNSQNAMEKRRTTYCVWSNESLDSSKITHKLFDSQTFFFSNEMGKKLVLNKQTIHTCTWTFQPHPKCYYTCKAPFFRFIDFLCYWVVSLPPSRMGLCVSWQRFVLAAHKE